MKGFQLNPNHEYTSKIIEGIYRKSGHCPCKVKMDDSTLCPCDDFIKKKECTCKLYVPISEE